MNCPHCEAVMDENDVHDCPHCKKTVCGDCWTGEGACYDCEADGLGDTKPGADELEAQAMTYALIGGEL